MIEVDQAHPWPGLASFSEATRAFFHGRDEEVAELARRVQRKLLTVLFGQSGLGKTSILRAGIVPRLRAQGYCPVYVRIDYGPAAPSPAEQVRLAMMEAARWRGTAPGEGESLWELLHRRDAQLVDGEGNEVVPLFIFDQFEEIFTLAQADDGGRARAAQFVEELAQLVENRPPRELEARLEIDDSLVERLDFARADYRVLIALREDYLAHLEGLKGSMPGITQNRMRLAPMTGQQALSAVRGPGAALVDDEVAAAIVRFVAGGAEVAHAQVEPSLLSLICRELNDARIAAGRGAITLDLLAGSHASILSDFYERALAGQPAPVRQVVEDLLLTDSGYRENVAEERVRQALAAAGAAPGTLAELVNRRLLRIEERLDLRRVELTHDVLCPVVRASRDLRQQREAREAAERTLAQQHERELAARRSLRRMRQAAVASVVLAACALAASGYAYRSTQRAKAAAEAARATRIATDQARGQAEQLTAYLLDDFARELDGAARQDVFLALGKQVLRYYDAQPDVRPGSDSELYRTLAQVTYGATLERQGRLAEAGPVLNAAVKVFERRARSAPGERNDVGLAQALLARADLDFGLGDYALSEAGATRARVLLQPFMDKAQPALSVRRAFAKALLAISVFQRGKGLPGEAVAGLTRAREIDAGMGALALTDVAAALAYSEASSALSEASYDLGRSADAARFARDSYVAADKVLALRPDHLVALQQRAMASEVSGHVALDAGRTREAIADATGAIGDYERLLQLDPGNSRVFEASMDARKMLPPRLYDLGEIAQSRRAAEDLVARARRFGKHRSQPGIVALHGALFLAAGDSQGGRPAAAHRWLASAQEIFDQEISHTKDRFIQDFLGGVIVYEAAELAIAEGRPAEAAAMLRKRIESDQRGTAPKVPLQVELHDVLLFHEGRALYALGDYAASEKVLREASMFGAGAGKASYAEYRRRGARFAAAHAMALAALHRDAEAAAVIGPVIARWRTELRSGTERVWVNQDLADALATLAMATRGRERAAALAEARGLLARLPDQVRQMLDVKATRARVERLGSGRADK